MKIQLQPKESEKKILGMTTFLYDIEMLLFSKGWFIKKRDYEKGWIEVYLERRRIPSSKLVPVEITPKIDEPVVSALTFNGELFVFTSKGMYILEEEEE